MQEAVDVVEEFNASVFMTPPYRWRGMMNGERIRIAEDICEFQFSWSVLRATATERGARSRSQ
jgi:hypothetical protein